jgi:hypothetical protein
VAASDNFFLRRKRRSTVKLDFRTREYGLRRASSVSLASTEDGIQTGLSGYRRHVCESVASGA